MKPRHKTQTSHGPEVDCDILMIFCLVAVLLRIVGFCLIVLFSSNVVSHTSVSRKDKSLASFSIVNFSKRNGDDAVNPGKLTLRDVT